MASEIFLLVTLVSPEAARALKEETMRNWTKPAITIVTIAAMSYAVSAQSGGDKMAKPMGKEKTYTGCIEAGDSAGTFTLTHVAAEMSMAKDGMKKDTMGKEGMSPTSLAISSKSVDLSKHLGHKVSVTGSDGTGMGMAKPDTMAKPGEMAKSDAKDKMPAVTVTAIKMIAATCSM